ncbi:polysaccharide biosynthesis protein [Aureivirga sp. CE67]|uniref:polysaccharide biosynthesis protein n=1 Tax=Aureivirga sp. CE67 TaxID=1788983 RepID=UPI0018CAEDF4|nr:nucleoside-diphosphate sugar epimerase/dehydratase [Aureivirga sp. CE67]
MITRILSKNAHKYASRWMVLGIDTLLIFQTYFLAYVIRYNFTFHFDKLDFIAEIPFVIGLGVLSFIIVGSYKGVIRHTGLKDANNVFMAGSLYATLCLIANGLQEVVPGHFVSSSISIIIIHYLLNIVILITSRFVFKTLYAKVISDTKSYKNVVIYGAGNSGLLTLHALVKDTKHSVKVVAFIDDNKKKVGRQIESVPIYSKEKISKEFISKNKISEIIISIQTIPSTKLLKFVDEFSQLGVNVKIVPPVDRWTNGDLNAKQIKTVKIEDILNRNPIEINNPNISKEVEGKVLLITGAAGSIGSEISRQLTKYNYKYLIILDQAESALYDLQQEFKQEGAVNFEAIVGDIRNKTRLKETFEKHRPDIVFHAAAYKHVPFVEENPYEGVLVNVYGSKVVMDLSVDYDVEKFVMVSTDKAVNPTNVMGATKRVAEIYATCLSNTSKTKFITTRFGNVLGSNGSVIPLFKKQIEKGGPLTLTHKDITRYFMTIPEACQLVLEAGAMGNGGEIFVFDMGESVKIFDMAVKMIHLSGLRYPEDIDIEIVGLRPGEKLYEELLSNEENTQPTYHEKIMIAKVQEMNIYSQIERVNFLAENLQPNNTENIVRQVKEIVPEYISNNSKYEKLDLQEA